MSYAHNEHYKWIESNCKITCSPLGREVANILGYVGRGIYNAPFNPDKVRWYDTYIVQVNWNSYMSNWDYCDLTNLVIECHRRMIRVSIEPNMRSIKLSFWQRHTREGGTWDRLPDIEEVIAMQDKEWGR